MIKSPLRYPGGKSRATGLIASLIPAYDEYREPLVGGASVFINQWQLNPTKRFWINDLYRPVYYFWLEAKRNTDLLMDNVMKFRKEFSDGRKLFYYLKENYDQLNDTEMAAAFFIFNRITFSGTSDSGGFSQAAFAGRFTLSSIERLKAIEPVLKNVKITNHDFEELINAKGNNVFIFCDPPYYSASKSALYGKNGSLHKSFDHNRFAESVKNCRHKYLITYDDCEYIRKLFSFANVFSWDLKYGMRNVGTASNQNGKELFISNYLTELPLVLPK